MGDPSWSNENDRLIGRRRGPPQTEADKPKREGRSHPFWVEPALLIHQLASKSFPLVTAEFLNARVEDDLLADIKAANNGTMGHSDLDIDGEVESLSSEWLLYLNLSRNLPAVFATFFLIPYTNKIGRKPAIYLPCIGHAVHTLMYTLVSYYGWSLDYLFIGSITEGLSGSHITITNVCYLYLTDVITVKERTIRFTIVHSLIIGSACVSRLAVGFLVDAVGYTIPYIIFTVLFIVDTIYIIVFLPESRRQEDMDDSRQMSPKTIILNTFGAFRVYVRRRPDPTARTQMLLLFLALTCDATGFLGRTDIDTLYVLDSPFNFSSVMVGYYLGLRAGLWLIAELTTVGVLQRWLKDVHIAAISVVSALAMNLTLAFAPNGMTIFIAAGLGLVSATVVPMAKSIMSKTVTYEEQGALIGTLGVMETLCDLSSSLLVDSIYSATVEWFSGFIYLFITTIYVVVGSCVVSVWCLQNKSEREGWDKNEAILNGETGILPLDKPT